MLEDCFTYLACSALTCWVFVSKFRMMHCSIEKYCVDVTDTTALVDVLFLLCFEAVAATSWRREQATLMDAKVVLGIWKSIKVCTTDHFIELCTLGPTYVWLIVHITWMV